jgi:hypothetical protein
MAVSVKTGPTLAVVAPQKLFMTQMRRTAVKLNYAATKDGKFLINTVKQMGSTPISVVLNWPSLLQN